MDANLAKYNKEKAKHKKWPTYAKPWGRLTYQYMLQIQKDHCSLNMNGAGKQFNDRYIVSYSHMVKWVHRFRQTFLCTGLPIRGDKQLKSLIIVPYVYGRIWLHEIRANYSFWVYSKLGYLILLLISTVVIIWM